MMLGQSAPRLVQPSVAPVAAHAPLRSKVLSAVATARRYTGASCWFGAVATGGSIALSRVATKRARRGLSSRKGIVAVRADKAAADQWFQSQTQCLLEERPAERFGTAIAERGLATLKELAAPARDQEPFRYTDLDALLYGLPAAPSAGKQEAEELESRIASLLEDSEEVLRLVFLDGSLCTGFSRLSASEDASIFVGGRHALAAQGSDLDSKVTGLLTELPEIDLFTAGPNDVLGCAKLAALNQALFEDVACICLQEASEADSETVVEVVFLTSGTRAALPRLVLDVGQNRRLKVIESHMSLSESDASLSNGLCRVVAAQGAQVQHEVLQQKGPETRWVHSVTAEVAAGASYNLRAVQSGARVARLNAAIALQGDASSCEVTGVMMADGQQQLDLHSLIHHSVPSCRSSQRHKNMVGGSAECIFKGSIKVDAEAQQTLSDQIVRSLLLSKKSKVKAMPSLQIQADDVSCSHGAALAQLDPEQVFYMASRGLDGKDAKRLLLAGFPEDLLLGLKEIAPRAHQRVQEKLSSMAVNAESES
eukprot:TRINITY_DN30598_c0_g1_i1.p1 TRINITY_DN30598_c0_g1~~TRINITY_DN30598_c0_g1_i1.p1  ORF type:complete len:539 (-),score=118.77 TRINITY_DN30598_c0_g1_i1:62-1678(-)